MTDFGKVADPIADKALTGAALISLSIVNELPWWVTMVILAREIGVTLLRFWVIRHGVIAASRGGKLKTLLQGVSLGLYVLPLTGWLHEIAVVVMAVAIVVTLVTGADYVFRALAVRRAGRAPRRDDRGGAGRPTDRARRDPGGRRVADRRAPGRPSPTRRSGRTTPRCGPGRWTAATSTARGSPAPSATAT